MPSVQRDILILDDDPDIRTLLERILSNAGMNVLSAFSVGRALELAAARVPHLVICDLQMPGESGFDFLERRKANPKLARVPVIVLSARKDKPAVHQAMTLGAVDYLNKPFTATLLLQRINKALRDSAFLSHAFPKDGRPTGTFSTLAKVTYLGETSFTLSTSVKFAPESQIGISSEQLEDIGFADCTFKTSSRPGYLGEERQFVNAINVVGLKDANLRLIRKRSMRYR